MTIKLTLFLFRFKQEKILAKIAQLLGVVEKLSLFESAILKFFCKKIFFCFIPIKISLKFLREQGWVEVLMIMYPGFQPKGSWDNIYAQDCTCKKGLHLHTTLLYMCTSVNLYYDISEIKSK